MLYMESNNSKIINSRCICGLGLGWTDDQIIMVEPCEHIFHKNCIQLKICPICESDITKYYTEESIKPLIYKDCKYYQKYVDLVCVKNINKMSKKNLTKLTTNLPSILDILSKLPFSRGFDEGHKLCEMLFTVANVKLSVVGKKNMIKNNVIIIANHTSIMDFMIMFYVFKCGFLASSSVKETTIGKLIAEIIPILFIDRGKDKNTVNKMKDYVKNQGSLCLFPEGIIVHPNTLAKFRTGAFYVDKPILPVIINYKPLVSDSSIGEFLQKLTSQNLIEVTVKILPCEYPPFDNDKIERIRNKMAKRGNLALSRVSNRDVVDN